MTSSVEGREFRRSMRWPATVLILLFLGAIGIAAFAAPRSPRGADPRALSGVLALMILPVVAFALTSRLSLENGALVHRSIFGTRRLPLSKVRSARFQNMTSKGTTRQHFILEGPTTLRVISDTEGYADLRDAILRALPEGVRPRVPA